MRVHTVTGPGTDCPHRPFRRNPGSSLDASGWPGSCPESHGIRWSVALGALVSFRDDQGTVWSVQEDPEGLDEEPEVDTLRPRAVRLRFASELEERTLHGYPDDWARLEPRQLQVLLRRATPVVIRFARRNEYRNAESDRG